jgi:hypothetical protein
MKKIISLVMSLTVATVVFAGCGSKTNTNPGTATTTGGAVKTGLAIVTSVSKSTDATAKAAGLAETDSTIAAVTVDKDGKIVKCIVDAAQSKINFSVDGKITTDLKTIFKPKQELKEEYGMKKASKIGKEWYEEANAFAAYVVGKTADQVKGIAVTAEGAASDKELSSSVTVHVGDFITAVVNAAKNAQDLGAKTSDKLGLGVTTSMASSKDAADKDGLAQAYSYYTASTFTADGKITSCVIDATQGNVNFTKAGKITTDIKAAIDSKDVLGEKYGMKKASKIGKEWNEEAAAFAKYVVGKTAADVKGIAVTAEGSPSGSDLTGSVTIGIGDFLTIIEKASQSAK